MSTVYAPITLYAAEQFVATKVSPETRRAYQSDLEGFQKFMRTHWPNVETVDAIKPAHLEFYKVYLSSTYKNLTANRKLACVKSYFRFLIKNGAPMTDPSLPVSQFSRSDYRPTPALSDREVQALMRVTQPSPIKDAVFHLAFYMGLRRSEIAGLRMRNIKTIGGQKALEIIGKGRKTRIIPMHWTVLSALERYLAPREVSDPNEPLFTFDGKNPIHPATIAKWFVAAGKSAGIQSKISPHCARSTAVSNALERGATIPQVQQLGGWTSPDMPLRYNTRRIELKDNAAHKIQY